MYESLCYIPETQLCKVTVLLKKDFFFKRQR